jgi:hypothetical protein
VPKGWVQDFSIRPDAMELLTSRVISAATVADNSFLELSPKAKRAD